jgi:hypothetical protein
MVDICGADGGAAAVTGRPAAAALSISGVGASAIMVRACEVSGETAGR